MWLKPDEFYDLDVEEYLLFQKAQVNKMQTEEGKLRRSAFIIGKAASLGYTKKFDEWFEQVWPYGNDEIKEKIDDRITRLRQQAKTDVEFLNKHAARIKEVVALKRKAQNAGRGS